MIASARHAARVTGALVRTSLMTGLQYRADFVFDSLTGALRTAATAAPLGLIYLHIDQVMGWTLPDAALVMALFLVMEGLLGGLVEPNLGEVVEAIRTGNLDLVLMKPADAQLLVSLRRVAPAHVWDVLAGLALGAWALAQGTPPSAPDVAVAVSMLLCGLASMYSLWLLAICASFFFVRVDNLRFLLWAATDAGRWPIPVFNGWVRWFLTIAIPVAIVTSFPALALRGDWDRGLVAVGLGTSAAFVSGSRCIWRRALASYTSASS